MRRGAWCSCCSSGLTVATSDQYDAYIVLSFDNGTLVLSIGETIEEVSDTGFISSAPTLGVQQLGTSALLQIYPRGIRHILADKRVNEWKVGPNQTIVAATTNRRQVVVALSNNEIVYFELDMDGQLNEFQERKDMGGLVLCLSIAEVPEGRQRTPYLVSRFVPTPDLFVVRHADPNIRCRLLAVLIRPYESFRSIPTTLSRL